MLGSQGSTWLRWGSYAALVVCFTPLVGWAFILPWLLTVLFVGDWALPRIARGASITSNPQRWALRAVLGIAAIYATLGGLAIIAALRGGIWGLVSGQFLTFTLVLTFTARRSKMAYWAAMAPLGIILIVLAGLSFALTSGRAGPIVMCVSSALLLAHNHRIAAINRTLAIEAEAARAAAEASTAAKSAFVAMVSHELRTPLSGILAGATELSETSLDAKSKSTAGLVAEAAKMMRSLLNDLLDLSKIEAGRMGVETVAFDLRATLLETVRFWRPELRRKNLFLHLEGARSLPHWVEGDPTRLRQILNNLFSNSTKFTDSGGITLRTSAEQHDDGEVRITIDVADTGPGMSEPQMQRLFNAFEQLGSSTARTHGGTGLGLHISREFARMMKGDITVSSSIGLGATFTVELNLSICAAPVSEAARQPANELLGLRLLIVDDHEVNRRAFSLILEPIAAELVCVEDGEQALACLAVQDFDIVLMDIHMPNLDGREATARLRSTPGANQHVPVIALTGAVSARDVDAYLAAGMNAFVTKPTTPLELLTAVDQVLNTAQFSDERVVMDLIPGRQAS